MSSWIILNSFNVKVSVFFPCFRPVSELDRLQGNWSGWSLEMIVVGAAFLESLWILCGEYMF